MTVTISETFSFNPSATASPPYSFSFTANSETWSGECRWNLAGQRWYLYIYDSTYSLIKVTPLISSPVGSPQDLLQGAIDQTVLYYIGNNAQIQIGVSS